MKKTIAILLTAALVLSLAGCAAETKTPAPAETAAVTAAPEAQPETPSPGAEPAEAETPESAAAEGRLFVEVARSGEEFYSDDGQKRILSYYCAVPAVTVEGRADAAAAINETLEKERVLFAEGDPDQEGLSGREAFLTAAREDYAWHQKQGTAEDMAPFELRREVRVTRGDDRVLSLAFIDQTFTGGVHGYAAHWGLNFDTLTGEVLTLADLSEDETFLDDCAQRLFAVASGPEYAMRGLFDDYAEYLPGLLRESNWYFSSEGLVVLANAYEIGPYAAGTFSFTLPWNWLTWHVKPEYVPRSAADGELVGEIRTEAPAEAAFTWDDNTNGQGAAVVFTASGRVEGVSLSRAEYWEFSNTFFVEGTRWYVSDLADGETVCLRTWIPEIIPNLALTRTDREGTRTDYISQSGRDGSLVLLRERDFLSLPLEISRLLPFDWDIDGDGDRETLDLCRVENNGASRWQLLVDGTPAPGEAYGLDAELLTLWLCDLDDDGTAELFFSGDMGSDDYVTCGWHGDTLAPIVFTGAGREDRDGEETAVTVDGRAVISGWTLVLDRWNYQLGTYRATRPFQPGEDGALAPLPDRAWEYRGNTGWLTVSADLPVTLDGAGETALPPDTELRLLSSDGGTVRFVTRDGQTGSLSLAFSREGGDYAGWTIAGRPEAEYFAFLPYVG